MISMSKLTGDWSKANSIFNNLGDFQEKAKALFKDKFAREIEVKLKEDIMKQNLDLAPLTKPYASKKQGNTILVNSGEYVGRLKVIEIKEKDNYLGIVVGASGKDKHSSGLTIADLAMMIEYGTRNQPARPHFRFSWERMQFDAKNEVRDIYTKELKRILSGRG